MQIIDLAKKYMDIFYESGDFDALHEILDAKLRFEGPLYTFCNAKDYIDSLKQAPPTECSYEILEEYKTDHSACLVYRFSKHGKSTLMSQSFFVVAGRISMIRLIFNTSSIK